VSAGLLTVENGQFANTEEASHYLVKGKPSYMGNHVFVSPFLNYHIWGAAVKTAEIIRAGEIQKFDYSTASQEQLAEIFRSTMPIAIRSGEELAKKYDFTPYSTIFVLGHIMDDSKVSPEEEVGWYLLNLHWDDEAGFYTEQDQRDMLQEAGFEDIERDTLPNGDGLMIARNP